MKELRASACVLQLVLLSGCGPRLDAGECVRLLDRYVELLAQGDRPSANAGEVRSLQQEARKKAARDPAFAECSSRVSRRAFDCAMAAGDANRLEQCLL